MYYAKSTGGFYDTSIHGKKIPANAVEISDSYHSDLLQAQSAGKKITANEDGYPIAIDPPTPMRTTVSLLAEVASKRWQVETGGIVVAGSSIQTDRESQAQLYNSYTSLKSGLVNDTQWKAADDTFVLVTLTELEPIAQAIAAHVRACFAAEEAHSKAIAALQTQAELDAYDIGVGWPIDQ
ncbi:TPA: DUF4376 domain-containing protein [Aeromonas salmonicida]|uniref:DUF4376 domain-containing protein n=1 Tax=Aeromonas salmonicida TaxID=645 RepID=UPI00330AA69C|nr:DUF4376 domain-containing protein [Aeromonas salmonicida]